MPHAHPSLLHGANEVCRNWKRMALMAAIRTRNNGVRPLEDEISSFSKPKKVLRVDPRDELLRELDAIKAAGARR